MNLAARALGATVALLFWSAAAAAPGMGKLMRRPVRCRTT
jgi:hypothetical protein